ncbi:MULTISPECIES: hypothetical protein [Gallibacterium]|uniref:Uncharacterized protein n=2 Tax=Gallibacterium TaxID=155493 RepID=A0A0A2XCJ5_9PAST|nr:MULTISPECIES: hypothetical protein [Gallibacterium]KGQ30106.1 hypothetical protein P375_10930 [Gallibacterium genomosp. 2]KGQ63857.1 hypothetical protein IO48_00335 [Gallibacterium anatis 4895]
MWDVGVRIGTALKQAYLSESKSTTTEERLSSSHKPHRPHIRKAHWHGFRSGKMKDENGNLIPADKRKFELKWLPPIAVNVEYDIELPVVIHKAKVH